MFKSFFTKMCGVDPTEFSEIVEKAKKVEEAEKEEGQETDRERQKRELRQAIMCYKIHDDYIPTHRDLRKK